MPSCLLSGHSRLSRCRLQLSSGHLHLSSSHLHLSRCHLHLSRCRLHLSRCHLHLSSSHLHLSRCRLHLFCRYLALLTAYHYHNRMSKHYAAKIKTVFQINNRIKHLRIKYFLGRNLGCLSTMGGRDAMNDADAINHTDAINRVSTELGFSPPSKGSGEVSVAGMKA